MVGPQLVELAPRVSPAADLGHAALEAGLVAAGVVGEQVPAPGRAILLARQGLILAQLGRTGDAVATVEAASRNTADNRFEADLLAGLHVARGDRRALESIADRGAGSAWAPGQRAQARIALGDLPGALEAYTLEPPDPRAAIVDLINDEWVWRLPHVVNHAHLRIAAGDEAGRDTLRELCARAGEMRAEGIVNADALYWVASAHAVLGDEERALEVLEEAVTTGWRHAWWARHDWNWSGLAGDTRLRDLLARGGPSP